MNIFRKNFFQLLLVILALAFTICIKYLDCTEAQSVGTFGNREESNITLTDALEKITHGGDVR